MKNYRDPSLRIRLGGLALLGLFITLAGVAYFSGQQMERNSDLIVSDAVPGTIAAHKMRMAMSRSIGWVMVAASAQTPQSRDASLKTVHEADTAFADAVNQYKTTIKINPTEDKMLLDRVASQYAEYNRQRQAYEALIMAGNREASAVFLENNLVPAYVRAIKSAEELLAYNHANSVTYANYIHDSVHRLYWAEAVVIVLALVCAVILAVSFSVRQQEIRELQESEEKFSKAFRSNPVGIAITKMETGEYQEVNESFCQIMGYSSQELIGRTPVELGIWRDMEDRKQFFKLLFAGETLRDLEMQTFTREGANKTVLVNAELIELGGRHSIVSLVQDITDRKRSEERIHRLNRTYAMLSGVNQTIVHESESQRMLETVCRVAVEQGGFRMAWIGLVDATKTKLNPVASHGFVEGYLEALKIDLKDETRNKGPAAKGLLSGKHILCCDIENDPSMLPWRDEALRRGYKSSACFPLKIKGDTVGVFNLYSAEVEFFDDEELRLLDELADDISFALEVEQIQKERKQLEQKRSDLADIVESSDDAIIGKTLEGIITSWNRGAENIFGYSAEEIVGKSMLTLYPPDRQKEEAEILARIAHGETVDHFETERIRKSGERITISATISPLRDEKGHVIGASKIARDITKSMQTQEELKWKTAFLEAQVDSSYDGILVVDERGKRILQNEHLLQLFKVPDEIACDDDHSKLLEYATNQMKDPQQFKERVAYLYAHPDEIGRDEIELKNGMILDRYSAPVRDKAGKYYGRIWTFRDITERKKLEQQFLRAQRMESIGTLAGGIAHDLNNVLSPIMMAIAILEMREQDRSSKELLATISVSAQRGADMVRQVLSFARGVEGKRMEVQVKHLLKEIEKIANDTFLKNIQIRTIVPNGLYPILGDPTQLHQVLLNLCVNARDAMPNGGALTLSAENFEIDEFYAASNAEAKKGSYVLIQIEDTGTGMSPEIIEKIFDPFFTTKELGKGTGLGLSTTLGIVKSHGGFIRVYSELGRGTKFKVYLPAQTELAATAVEREAAEMPRGNDELILVIDDEASVRLITQRTLEAYGYQVVLASDGADALAIYAARKNEIAVVLTDMMMPVMDGPATIRALQYINPAVKVIGASGLTANDYTTRASNLGVKHFLPKPFTAETLLKELKNILEES